MGRSAGPGSPINFRCPVTRSWDYPRRAKVPHEITLTGRTKPYHTSYGHTMGLRSTHTSREYICSCGHRGWSNHCDLKRLERNGQMNRIRPFSSGTQYADWEAGNCSSCKHFDLATEDRDSWVPSRALLPEGWGQCLLAHNDYEGHRYPLNLSVALDHERYEAHLAVSPDYGCVQHEDR